MSGYSNPAGAGAADRSLPERDPGGLTGKQAELALAGPGSEENLAKVRALNDVAKRRGQSLAQMALAWTLRDPRITSALIGASSVAQLEQNVAALENAELSADELEEIDRYATESGINIWERSSAE